MSLNLYHEKWKHTYLVDSCLSILTQGAKVSGMKSRALGLVDVSMECLTSLPCLIQVALACGSAWKYQDIRLTIVQGEEH